MASRSSRRYRHSSLPCSCLLDAFRSFPTRAQSGQRCASPDCPVRSLDSVTLHRFLEAIGRPDGHEGTAAKDRAHPTFQAIAKRLRRR